MSKLISGRDFVVFGQQAWDNPIGSNNINISEEIAKDNRVLYVNFPLDRKTLWQNKETDQYLINSRRQVLKGNKSELEQVNDNLWVFNPRTIIESINMLPDGFLFDYFNKINNRRISKRLLKALKKIGFKDVIVFNDSDIFRSFYQKENLKPKAYVYYSRDNLMTVDYWRKHGERLEPQLIAKSDLAVANSTYLRDLCAEHNSNSHYIGQGCDLSLFDSKSTYEVPAELQDLKGPKIGYIGALMKTRLDIDLLVNLAKNRPDWNIVLVGPEDENFKSSELHQLQNVVFTGSQKLESLPSYLSHFDVAINPQVLAPVTIGNYPRKIDEYLAMGVPTVATKTRAMEIFEEHTLLAETHEDYFKHIETAMATDSPEKRKARMEFAHTHTWENSVGELYKHLLDIL